MVEIFHCFNMRSRRASLFTMKKQNKWLWASAALALVLTVIVTVQPTLAEMFFGPVTLELKGVIAAPWQLTTQEDYYTLLDEANMFGLAKKQFFPAE